MALSITDVRFTNYGQTKDFLFGHIGDEITVEVDFETTFLIERLDYLANQINNSEEVGTDGDGSNIDSTLFDSLTTLTRERYNIQNIDNTLSAVNTLNLAQPRQAGINDSVTLVHTGTATNEQYTLTHTTYIREPRGEDVDTDANQYTTPPYFEAEECLKYIYQIDAYSDAIDPNATKESTEDLTMVTNGHIKLGNTGNFGERLNGGAPIFALDSFTINEGELYNNSNNTFKAVFSVTGDYPSVTFNNTFEIKLYRSRLVETNEFEVTEDSAENTLREVVTLTAANSPFSNGSFQGFYYFVDTGNNTLTLQGTVQGNGADNNIFYATLFDTVTPANLTASPVFIQAANQEEFVNDTALRFNQDNRRFADFNFFHDNLIDATKAFNHDAIYRGKYCRFETTIENTDVSGLNVVGVTVGLKDANGEIESFTTNEFPFTLDRGYNLTTNDYTTIEIEQTGNFYRFKYPFFVKQSFGELQAFVSVEYTQEINKVNVTQVKTFESADIETLTFYQDPVAHAGDSPTLTDFTDAAPVIPYAGTTPVLKYYTDNTYATEINYLRIDAPTYCEATFVEQNSDLQVADVTELTVQCSVNSLGGNEFTEQYLHTDLDNSAASPLVGTVTANRPQVDIIGVDTVRIRFYIDQVKLLDQYGANEVNLKVNLDNVQINEIEPYTGLRSVFIDNGNIYVTEYRKNDVAGTGDSIFIASTTNEEEPQSIIDRYANDGIDDPSGLTYASIIDRYVITSGLNSNEAWGFYSDFETPDLIKTWDDAAGNGNRRSIFVSYAAAKSDILFVNSLAIEAGRISAVDAYSGGTSTQMNRADATVIGVDVAGGTSVATVPSINYIDSQDEIWIACYGASPEIALIKIYDYNLNFLAEITVNSGAGANGSLGSAYYNIADDRYYLTDSLDNEIKVYDPNTRALDTITPSYTTVTMDTPRGVWVDGTNLYVADNNATDAKKRFYTIPK